jgi:hypothetical protein
MTEYAISETFPAVLLFTDIVDSSVHSSILGIKTYAKRVLKFHRLFDELGNVYFPEVARANKVTEWGKIDTRGDEGTIFLLDADEKGPELMLRAVKFAFELKARWLLINKEWIIDFLKLTKPDPSPKLMDIAVGIHYGLVTSVTKSIVENGEARKIMDGIMGYPINYAKRVESSSRVGRYSKVFMSKQAAHLLAYSDIFLQKHNVSMKGVGDTEEVYEVRAIIDDKIIIGGDAGGIPANEVAGLVLGKFDEQDVLREHWLKSYILCESKCTGTDEKAKAYLKLLWSKNDEDDPVCLLGRAEDCNHKGKHTRAITYLKLILKDNPDFKRARIMLIDNCWKAIESKGKLTAEHILVRDTADELLTNYRGNLSTEEKEKLKKLIDEVEKKKQSS